MGSETIKDLIIYTMLFKPVITYSTFVWWPEMKPETALNRLGMVQILACSGSNEDNTNSIIGDLLETMCKEHILDGEMSG